MFSADFVYSCALICCRFVVTQNRQAVGVQDPLQLAHHLEKLGGTAKLMELIYVKQQDIRQLSQQCEDLTDDTHRYSQTRVTYWKSDQPFLGVCLVSVMGSNGPKMFIQTKNSFLHIASAYLPCSHCRH